MKFVTSLLHHIPVEEVDPIEVLEDLIHIKIENSIILPYVEVFQM